MMRIARDRTSNPSLDLDQTASSCVAVLPHTKDQLPVFWWAPSVPSSSCYIPFFVHGSGLPKIVSTAGTYGRKIMPPSQVEQDEFSPESLWWLFRDLCDLVNIKWDERNPIVRHEFDELEKTFEAGVPEIITKAVTLRKAGNVQEAAQVLDEYTAGCVEKVLTKVNELRELFKDEAAEVPEQYRPYVGKYIANFGPFQNAAFMVKVQNDHLAVDVPGQMVFELNEPDEEGKWFFMMTNMTAVSFVRDETGRVTSMRMHQTTPMPKKAENAESDFENVPEAFRPYVGKYTVPMRDIEYTVIVQDDCLALNAPGQGTPVLNPPDEKGVWVFQETDLYSISFVRNDSGKVTALNLHQAFPIQKGESAALVVEEAIEAAGIEEGLTKYHDIKTDHPDDYFFDEGSFNALGYRLLQNGKVAEAIEIFKLNVKAYPESFNVYDSLGEAYMTQGNRELAIQNYRKSVALNPQNENGKEKLEKLEEEK